MLLKILLVLIVLYLIIMRLHRISKVVINIKYLKDRMREPDRGKVWGSGSNSNGNVWKKGR